MARSSVSRRFEMPPSVRMILETVPFTAKSADAAVTIAYPRRGYGAAAGRAPWRVISVTGGT